MTVTSEERKEMRNFCAMILRGGKPPNLDVRRFPTLVEKALDALEAVEAALNKSRSVFCIWCGESVARYEGLASELSCSELERIYNAYCEYVCSKNPLKIRLDDVIRERDVLAEALNDIEPPCSLLNWDSCPYKTLCGDSVSIDCWGTYARQEAQKREEPAT